MTSPARLPLLSHSSLLFLPWELRSTIWSLVLSAPSTVHLCLRKNYFVLLPCDPSPVKEPTEHQEEREAWTAGIDRSIVDRLNTTWGTHWRCEEQQPLDYQCLAAVSPTVLDDMRALLRRSSVHLVGYEALEHLRIEAEDPTRSVSCVLGLVDSLHVQMTLRLPFDFFKAIESPTTLVDDHYKLRESWSCVGTSLATFRHLQSLEVLFDHDGSAKWAEINERCLVSPFRPIIDRSALAVTILFPWLHPWFEDGKRHFVAAPESDHDTARFQIRRFIRQSKFVKYDEKGEPFIITAKDFPYLTDRVGNWDLAAEELIGAERSLFLQGVNVHFCAVHLKEMWHDAEYGNVFCNMSPRYIPGEVKVRRKPPTRPDPDPLNWSVWVAFMVKHNSLWKEMHEVSRDF